jgi:hypothetical protein
MTNNQVQVKEEDHSPMWNLWKHSGQSELHNFHKHILFCGDEYEDYCLLGCCVITLMMKAVRTSETSVNFYHTTWCNIPYHLQSLLCSQKAVTGSHPEPDESSPHRISPRPTLIASSHLCPGLSSGLFPFGFLTKCMNFSSVPHVLCVLTISSSFI